DPSAVPAAKAAAPAKPRRRPVRFRVADTGRKPGLFARRVRPWYERRVLPFVREKAKPFLKKWIPPRAAAAAVFLLLYALPVAFLCSGLSFVVVRDGGHAAGLALSRAKDAAQAAADCGVEVRDEDTLTLTPCDGIYGAVRTLSVARAFAVRVTADGATAQLYTAGDTVAAVLARAGIGLGEDDLVTPAPDAVLRQGDEIVVRRVTYETRVVEETVPAQQVVKLSPLLADGVTRAMTYVGRAGAARVEYRDRYVDGVLDGTETVSSVYTKYPWNYVTLQGSAGSPASPIDGSKYTDVQIVGGVPSSYESVKTAQPCTAYSFKPGVWGGSGMYLVQGMVAVNPDEYDYGDLLYITSADGSFVYGWAIAADAGAAMVDGRVEIDCFFETYGESLLFGKRWLDVYVVGHLTQSDLREYMAQEGMFRARVPAD
ncbi:MAG: ubiquitin-like domain-containing protein, partial [Oscillospiraceae bacterium]|nr:ubiquitin-like domain-containing protein [Oscillospiraceae bacterium]